MAVNGVIQNLGSSYATQLSVNALFYDEGGTLVAARDVQFQEGPMAPGTRRNFSVSLPHSLIYDEIRFGNTACCFNIIQTRESPPRKA